MVVLFLLLLPNGVDLANASRAVLGQQTPVVFLGLAVIVTIAVGEFDLSFAYVYGLAGTAFPALVVLHHWPVLPAILVALGAALLVGLVNAVLVVIVGINSIVVTLGTGTISLGIALFLSNQSNVSGLDPGLAEVALHRFLGLPAVFWYGVVLVIVTAYVMTATPLGRSMLFVGSNPNVARLAGIPVRRVRFGAYLTAALLSGVIGIILACGVGGFSTATAQVQLMPALAAVFLGTIAVIPGRFNAIGMVIAAYFLLTGVFGLQLLGLSGWVTNVFYGAALIVAITVSLLLRRRTRA
jgi:ribose transport system permease protein